MLIYKSMLFAALYTSLGVGLLDYGTLETSKIWLASASYSENNISRDFNIWLLSGEQTDQALFGICGATLVLLGLLHLLGHPYCTGCEGSRGLLGSSPNKCLGASTYVKIADDLIYY